MTGSITLCFKENKVIGLYIDDFFLKLKEPVDMNRIGEIINIALKFVTYFNLSEIAKVKPPEAEIESKIERFLEHYSEGEIQLKILELLVLRDKISEDKLIKETSISEKAGETNPGKYLAGILAGITRIARKYKLGKIIVKDEEGYYKIREDIRPLLRRKLLLRKKPRRI